MADQDSRAGLHYGTPPILQHVAALEAPHDDALEWAFTAPSRTTLPAIQVGPSEGKFLSMLVRLVGARRILEIGTLAGYSGIHLARGLPAGGRLLSLDRDPVAVEIAREAFARAGVADRVEVRLGDAVDLLPAVAADGPFDLVFLDADKGRYDVYVDFAAANLRPGGLVVGDNAFFFGHLLDDSADARAMRRFHERLARDFEAVTLPTPDGLAIGIRRG